MAEEKEDQSWPNGWLGGLAAVLLMLVLVAAMAALVWTLVPGSATRPKNPGFLDTIVANRVLVTVIRFTLFAAGLYIVVSVVALIRRGEWLRRAGPLEAREVKDSVQAITQERDELAGQLATAEQTITTLQAQLGNTMQTLKQTRRDLKSVAHRTE